MNDLIPRAPKRKRQPTAACMREQLALAADQIIWLRTELTESRGFVDYPRLGAAGSAPIGGAIDPTDFPPAPRPWWRRLFSRGLE